MPKIKGVYEPNPQEEYYWKLIPDPAVDPAGCMLCLVRDDGTIAYRILEIRDGTLYRYPVPEDAAYELGLKTTYDNYLAGVADNWKRRS